MKYKIPLLLISLLLLTVLCFYLKRKYNQHLWQKTITSTEHKLQLGSFIFSKVWRADGGSQWYKTSYSVFKVIRIKGDFVRVEAVNKLYLTTNLLEEPFLSPSDEYENLKKNIANITVTGILREDLYKQGGGAFVLTKDLKEKYPGLNHSRYYYEDMPDTEKIALMPKNKIDEIENWMGITYSAAHIVNDGKLVPYTLTNDFGDYKKDNKTPFLAPDYGTDIDLIVNKKQQ
ncbi:hypothetical protein [Pedobacter nototheniae]|uniref:hypothetical protein n=1 Tax=Pedobacter nototheniae TaxID=2488994 RepID=UPI00292D5583|nr:hypothetical protein [Pedobacter nototheniae]